MAGLSFTWTLRHQGWAFCTIADDHGQAEAIASDITYGPEYFLRAVTTIAQAAAAASAEFEAEGIVFRWLFQRNQADAEIRLVKAADSSTPESDGTVIWSGRHPAADFARAVLTGFDQAVSELGEDCYRTQWGRAFPRADVEALRAACNRPDLRREGDEVNHLTRQQQRDLILSMAIVPGRGRKSSPEEVLRQLGTADGPALSLKLLRDAIERHDGTDVEMGLIAGFTYGFIPEHLEPLLELSSADWHQRHEDVVTALRDLHTPAAVKAFVHATRWIPAYLEFDESRALASKAIHALGDTPGPEARQALTELTDSDDEIVRETARRVLERRQAP